MSIGLLAAKNKSTRKMIHQSLLAIAEGVQYRNRLKKICLCDIEYNLKKKKRKSDKY